MTSSLEFETLHLPGLDARGFTVTCPLDAAEPGGQQIDVFARVYTAPGGEKRPYLVFLQGGPGSEAPRATLGSPSWIDPVLERYQVVMLDQRGTGRSTPVGSAVVVEDGVRKSKPTGALEGMDAAAQAEYLTHMRADEIVNDCERVREALGVETWTVMGQSFGGFTTLNYLSCFPESIAGAIVTGGLSGVGKTADDVYGTTWRIMMEKSKEFYRRFPRARDRVRELMELAGAGEIRVANGDLVNPERLRSIGSRIGMQGGYEQINYLLELDHRSAAFRHDLAGALAFGGRNPIYAVLQESCYADGVATRWAAERTMPDEVREDVTMLSGEHVSRAMIAEDSELACFVETADILAAHKWPRLYDEAALAQADVPVAAAIYVNDPYVPMDFSRETASLLPDARTWVTSEYEHNGLRYGTAVIEHLLGLLDGKRWL